MLLKNIKISFIAPIALLIAYLLLGASQCSRPEPPLNVDDRPDIEKAVREFWSAKSGSEKITGISLRRIDDDIYLVSVIVENHGDVEQVVAQQFHQDDRKFWKIEELNGRWRRLLQIYNQREE